MSYPEETKIPEARFSNNRLRLSCNHLHLGLQTRRSGHRRVFSLFSARRQGPQWDSIVAFCQIRDLFVVRQFSQPPLSVTRIEFFAPLGRMTAKMISGPVFLTAGGITAEIFMESFAKAEFLVIWR